MDHLNDRVLVNFLMGRCTESELQQVNDWLNQSADHTQKLFQLEEVYRLGKLDGMPTDEQTDKAEKKLMQRLEREEDKQRRTHRLIGWMQYAAAFVGLCCMAALTLHFYDANTAAEAMLAVSTNHEIKELKLPDGTKVWLNKHTTLKYPQVFEGQQRTVQLEGEGYFEVTRNPEKPFVVQSEAMQVKVLGTVFNLKSDKHTLSAVATLLSGEVEVKGNRGEGLITLAPGQKAELNGLTRRLVVKQMDTGIENWHNHEFVFQKADLYTIARTLENSYGVKVILAPGIDLSKTYSGTLKKKENVEAVLNLIKNSIPLQYKIVGSSVFLSSDDR